MESGSYVEVTSCKWTCYINHVTIVTSTRYKINSSSATSLAATGAKTRWPTVAAAKQFFLSRRNADCSALVSRNWQELTTWEPSGLDKVASKWHQVWHQSGANKESDSITIATWHLQHQPQYLDNWSETDQISGRGSRLWSEPLDFPDADKMQKKWKHESDVTLWCRARANDPSVLHN